MRGQAVLEDKKRFFRTLDALDEDDDNLVDEGQQESLTIFKSVPPSVARSQPKRGTVSFTEVLPSRRRAAPLQLHAGLARSVSALGPSLTDTDEGNEVDYQTASSPLHALSPSTVSHLESNMSSSGVPLNAALPRAPGKRKRPGNIKLVPEPQRIFKDLVFYFFPNNDTNTARRMRITKALEYGATWVVEWCDEVTHIIVDKDVKYNHMVDYLKITEFPGNSIVVNENYPADCIVFHTLVNPKQSQYQVQNYVQPNTDAVVDAVVISSSHSSQSLQLKLATKDTLAQGPKIPSRTDESSNEIIEDTVNAKRAQEELHQNVSIQYNDALEEIILEAKGTEHLPLDIEDEDTLSPQASDDEETDTEDDRPRKMTKKSVSKPAGSGSENFQCMEKHDGKGTNSNSNARTIEILTEMGNYYDQIKDEWRTRAYRKAVSSLRQQKSKIMTKEEALQLPWVGERLAAKIEEIVWTNRLRRLENARIEPTDEALQTFLKIYGVGLSQATKWVMRGLKTLEDLEKHSIPLTTNQEVGIAHYEDFNSRIPRAEVAEHAATVRRALQAIDPNFTVTVGGSYRRGAESSGDIDCIISAPTASLTRLQAVVFDELVPQLLRTGFLKIALASHSSSDRGGTKWHGASALPVGLTYASETAPDQRITVRKGVWRRIDLLLVPPEQMGAALIYFTGNDIFNRSIRLLASRKKMRLNQCGLYKDVMRGRDRAKITEGELVEGRSERRIFEILGVPWRPPEHRIC